MSLSLLNLSTQVAEALKQGRTANGVSLLKGLNISFLHTHHFKVTHDLPVLQQRRMESLQHKDAGNP